MPRLSTIRTPIPAIQHRGLDCKIFLSSQVARSGRSARRFAPRLSSPVIRPARNSHWSQDIHSHRVFPQPGNSFLHAPNRTLSKLLPPPLLRPLPQEFLPAERVPVVAAVGQEDLIGGVDLPGTLLCPLRRGGGDSARRRVPGGADGGGRSGVAATRPEYRNGQRPATGAMTQLSIEERKSQMAVKIVYCPS